VDAKEEKRSFYLPAQDRELLYTDLGLSQGSELVRCG